MTALTGGCLGVLPARGQRRLVRLADLPEPERDQLLVDLAAGAGSQVPEVDLDALPGQVGVCYLIHATDIDGAPAAYEHAAHYLGWTVDLGRRLAQHRAGVAAGGARLVEVFLENGLRLLVSRLWLYATRVTEATLKAYGSRKRLCPICDPAAIRRALRPLAAAWAQPRTTPTWRWAW